MAAVSKSRTWPQRQHFSCFLDVFLYLFMQRSNKDTSSWQTFGVFCLWVSPGLVQSPHLVRGSGFVHGQGFVHCLLNNPLYTECVRSSVNHHYSYTSRGTDDVINTQTLVVVMKRRRLTGWGGCWFCSEEGCTWGGRIMEAKTSIFVWQLVRGIFGHLSLGYPEKKTHLVPIFPHQKSIHMLFAVANIFMLPHLFRFLQLHLSQSWTSVKLNSSVHPILEITSPFILKV